MRGKLVEGRIDTRVKIHFAERALTAAPGGKAVEKSAAKPVIGENAVKIGADHRAIGRDSTLRPAIQRQERPVAIRSAGAPHMDFIPPDRHIERVGMRRDLCQPLVAGKHRLDPQVTKPGRVAGRALDTVRIIQFVPSIWYPPHSPITMPPRRRCAAMSMSQP